MILSQTLSLHSRDSLSIPNSSLKLRSKHVALSIPSEIPIQARQETFLFETLIQARREELQSKHWYSPIHKRRSIRSVDPKAPIRHKHQSTSANPLSLLVCLCVGVFGFVVSVVDFWVLWLIFYFVFVGVCIKGRSRWWVYWFCRWRREREKKKEQN